MSKAVGVTCAIATQLLLDGHAPLNKPGILAPYSREICDQIRVKVEEEGIKMVERTDLKRVKAEEEGVILVDRTVLKRVKVEKEGIKVVEQTVEG